MQWDIKGGFMSNHPLKIGVKTHYKSILFWKYNEIKTFTEILVKIYEYVFLGSRTFYNLKKKNCKIFWKN